mmetsp:Transcript_7106/g.17027  ORF Transcript_7106/g.17027 Transcript_7106/m.17027 type:complete len:377 (+) Transcript_7106:127-1257(+)
MSPWQKSSLTCRAPNYLSVGSLMIHSPVLRLPRLKLLHHGPCGHKPHHTQNRTQRGDRVEAIALHQAALVLAAQDIHQEEGRGRRPSPAQVADGVQQGHVCTSEGGIGDMSEEGHLRNEHELGGHSSCCDGKDQQRVEDPRDGHHLGRGVEGQSRSEGSCGDARGIHRHGQLQRLRALGPPRRKDRQQDVQGHQQGGHVRNVLLGYSVLLELHGRHGFANRKGHFPSEEDDEQVPDWLQRGHAHHLLVRLQNTFRLLSRGQGILLLEQGHRQRHTDEHEPHGRHEATQRHHLEMLQGGKAGKAHCIAKGLPGCIAGGLVVGVFFPQHGQCPAVHGDVLCGAGKVHEQEQAGEAIHCRRVGLISQQQVQLCSCEEQQ